MIIIKYHSLKNHIKGLGFNDFQTKEAIKKIRNMDPEVKKAFFIWFRKGILPNITIEEVTPRDLVHTAKMDEVKAFLCLDWLKREPDAAKRALLRLTDAIRFEEDGLAPAQNDQCEDESDIEIPGE